MKGKEWLRGKLSAGPRSLANIKEEAAEEGISISTLFRAKQSLSIQTTRQQGEAYWHLIEHEDSIKQGIEDAIRDVLRQQREIKVMLQQLLNSKGIQPENPDRELTEDEEAERFYYSKKAPLTREENLQACRIQVKLRKRINLSEGKSFLNGIDDIIERISARMQPPMTGDEYDEIMQYVHDIK